jgi:hypothetical protein
MQSAKSFVALTVERLQELLSSAQKKDTLQQVFAKLGNPQLLFSQLVILSLSSQFFSHFHPLHFITSSFSTS